MLVAAGSVGAAHAATTSYDRSGTILFDGKPFFPLVLAPGPALGATTPAGADGLAQTVAAGINVFKIGPSGTWTSGDVSSVEALDAALQALHAYSWVNINGYANVTPGSPDAAQLAHVVRALTDATSAGAIAFWKGRDEPWWSKIPASELRYAYCRVTSRGDPAWCHGQVPLDPSRLWVTIEAPRGTAANLAAYSAVTDIHGVDIYPVTLKAATPDLTAVGSWTSTLDAIAPTQPVWTTLQICASGSWDASTGTHLLPTFAQERYMTYDAIIDGARALAFYGGNVAGCLSQADVPYGWNWTFWQSVLRPLVQELSASSPLAPALLNAGTSTPLQTSDPDTQAVVREGTSPDDLWVLASFSGAEPAEVTFSGLPSWATEGSVYTESRDVTVESGAFTDGFDPWSVHVYHFVEPLTLQPLRRTSGTVGSHVTLHGSGLEGARSVSFGGYAARFSVISDDELVATVPKRARSGPLVVRSASGSVTSSSRFAVLPSVAAAPRISGSPRIGDVLTASTGRWYGDRVERYAFAWERCNSKGLACTPISAARRERLTLGKASLGARLRVVVTARTAAGSGLARSTATAAVRG